MKISEHSRRKLELTFSNSNVGDYYSAPIINYLLYGYHPGSFFANVFENNFSKAILASHLDNTVVSLKNLVWWMDEYMPKEACGSPMIIDFWINLPDDDKRTVLESRNLIYTKKMEMVLALKDATLAG